jgi:hypothetical protein
MKAFVNRKYNAAELNKKFTLCNMMAIKTIISTSVCAVEAAAPSAIPSAEIIFDLNSHYFTDHATLACSVNNKSESCSHAFFIFRLNVTCRMKATTSNIWVIQTKQFIAYLSWLRFDQQGA